MDCSPAAARNAGALSIVRIAKPLPCAGPVASGAHTDSSDWAQVDCWNSARPARFERVLVARGVAALDTEHLPRIFGLDVAWARVARSA